MTPGSVSIRRLLDCKPGFFAKRRAAMLVVAGVLALLSFPAFAAQVEGADPRVLNAMRAAAQTRVAHAKAVSDEIYTQPDSNLSLSCFAQSASMTAQQAGSAFSGDVRKEVSGVVDDVMLATVSNFQKFTIGATTPMNDGNKAVDYTSPAQRQMNTTTLTPLTFNCDETGRLWTSRMGSDHPVNTGTPHMTQEQLLDPASTHPDASSMFNAGLVNGVATAARAKAREIVEGLPDPPSNLIPSCKGPAYNTPCKVMVCKRLIPDFGACP